MGEPAAPSNEGPQAPLPSFLIPTRGEDEPASRNWIRRARCSDITAALREPASGRENRPSTEVLAAQGQDQLREQGQWGREKKFFLKGMAQEKKKKNLKKGAEDSEQGLPLGSWHIFLDAFPGSTVSTRLQCAGKVCATDEKEAQAL